MKETTTAQAMPSLPSWRQQLPKTLDVQPGETVRFSFLDEGDIWTHPKFDDAVLFIVQVDGDPDPSRLFVRSKRLLRQIQSLGPEISGKSVELSREGSGLETVWELTTDE